MSVVYLENIEKADLLTQNSLSQAIRTGKFSDLRGREVSISNATFVTTSNFTRGTKKTPSSESAKYSEEMILRAKGRPVQILPGYAVGENITNHISNESLITRRGVFNPIYLNKRKLMGCSNENIKQHENFEIAKRAHKASNSYLDLDLDLNLPADENEVQETDNGDSDNDLGSENSKAWLENFFDQVDETVVFKPFDFDRLAEKILNQISERFHKVVGSECLLEVDSKVVEQILAAAYLSDRNRVVEDWVELVLSKGLAEAKRRYSSSLTAHSMKLVACEDPFSEEEQQVNYYLPSRIILN